ncbi:unnamed protein product [Ixodes hexagonus]
MAGGTQDGSLRFRQKSTNGVHNSAWNGVVEDGTPLHSDHRQNRMRTSRLGGAFYACTLSLYLTAALVVHHCQNSLPDAVGASPDVLNDGRTFVGSRAKSRLAELVSLGPRSVGSYENEVAAVDYLLRQLEHIRDRARPAHHVQLTVQRPNGSFFLGFIDGFTSTYRNIQNVIARIAPRGSESAGDKRHSVLVNCHFDTAPASPGASDDAINCAIMLEMLQVLSQRPDALRHPVIFLFNGAEENILQVGDLMRRDGANFFRTRSSKRFGGPGNGNGQIKAKSKILMLLYARSHAKSDKSYVTKKPPRSIAYISHNLHSIAGRWSMCPGYIYGSLIMLTKTGDTEWVERTVHRPRDQRSYCTGQISQREAVSPHLKGRRTSRCIKHSQHICIERIGFVYCVERHAKDAHTDRARAAPPKLFFFFFFFFYEDSSGAKSILFGTFRMTTVFALAVENIEPVVIALYSFFNWYVPYIWHFLLFTLFYLCILWLTFLQPLRGLEEWEGTRSKNCKLKSSQRQIPSTGACRALHSVSLIVPQVPLIQVSRNARVPVVFLVALSAFSILFAVSPLGFPFSAAPGAACPQRMLLFNVERTFHDQQMRQTRSDTGIWVVPLDFNGPRSVRRHMSKGRTVRPVDCSQHIYCGMPYYFPVISRLKESYYIEAAGPIFHNKRKFELVSQKMVLPNLRRLNFRLSGPSHMALVMSPRDGVELHGWSFTSGDITRGTPWHGRPTYFVYFSQGNDAGPWDFWVELKLPSNRPSSEPVLDVAFHTHLMQQSEHRQPEFLRFLDELPDWIHGTAWSSSVDLFVF